MLMLNAIKINLKITTHHLSKGHLFGRLKSLKKKKQKLKVSTVLTSEEWQSHHFKIQEDKLRKKKEVEDRKKQREEQKKRKAEKMEARKLAAEDRKKLDQEIKKLIAKKKAIKLEPL